MRCPLPGLLHGLALALFGGLLLIAWRTASSGCCRAPSPASCWWRRIVATGLYAVSRALEKGERADLAPRCACLEARRRPADRLRPAAGLCRHRLGDDVGLADHRLRPGPGEQPGSTS
jgi:hypothetical protein